MTNPKRPELKLGGNVSENFKNFELRFNDYCIQAGYRDLDKDPETEKVAHYKKCQLEISALRSAMPDEALQVIRYTIEPQIQTDDKKKPWMWMNCLRSHYTGSSGSCLMADRFKFWNLSQGPHETVQDWEVKVRQAGSLCEYAALSDVMCRDKFVFGLHQESMRSELLKTHLKSDNTPKSMLDVVSEAKTLESAQTANKLIVDASKHIEEQVNWTSHRQMRLKRERGTCHWCGDTRGYHAWKICPANGQICAKCGGNDHFAKVCMESPQKSEQKQPSRGQGRGRGDKFSRSRGSDDTRGRGRDSYKSSRAHDRNTSTKQDVHQLYGATGQYTDNPDQYSDEYQEQLYALEAQVHNVTAQPDMKRYFVNLQMSSTGSEFTPVKFQIDTAATCNTISDKTLAMLQPRTDILHSPYLLFPYGNSKPIHPLGQAELLCERPNKYETLVFQVLPDEVMGDKPALLSGRDSEILGLITVQADEVFSLSDTVTDVTDERFTDLPGYKLHPPGQREDTACESESQLAHSALLCNHVEQTNNSTTRCTPAPAPSAQIRIPASRDLPPPGQLCKVHVLQQYENNFNGLGCLGPPVSFKVNNKVTPVQMPIHRIPVAKREWQKGKSSY